jgi:hypothetical protein
MYGNKATLKELWKWIKRAKLKNLKGQFAICEFFFYNENIYQGSQFYLICFLC